MVESTMQRGDLTIARLVEYSRSAFPEARIRTWTGESLRDATFAEIGDLAAQLAHGLVELGVQPGDRVATFMWNNNEHQAVYAAVPSMGAILHTLNLRLSPEQAVFILNHADDRVILVDASVAPMLAGYVAQAPCVEHVIVVNGPADAFPPTGDVQVHAFEDVVAGRPTTYEWPAVDEDAAAVMCYTSGTTGDPKGVVYSHRSIYLHSMVGTSTTGLGLSNHDSVLVIVPMFHVMSWGLPYAAMMCGATLVMPDRYLQAEPLLAIMAASRPTRSVAVPTIWQGVAGRLEIAPQDISHMKEVVVGGAALPPALMETFDDLGVTLTHGWGMTETSPLGSIARVPFGCDDPEKAFAYRVTQGRFPAQVDARIVDETGRTLPRDGVAFGELQVRGPWITGSYYGPDGNVSEPSKFADGWLRTGDVATISPDGYMTIVDRTKDLIKTGGEWISSVELENAVMANPGIVEAVVIGVPDPKWDERPFVLAVVKSPEHADAEQQRALLAERLPKWQIPERWAFVEEVPKTSVGKFDKKRVRAEYAEGGYRVVDATAQKG